MANILLRRQAIELRKLGKSYNQIIDEIGVSKSTLSGWLKDYPLTQAQLTLLRDNQIRIERFRHTMQLKREARLRNSFNEAKATLLPLTKRELIIAGLFLYWGEGGKTERAMVTISNTDPGILKFSLYWMVKGLDIPKDRIKVFLHLYSDMNIDKAISYWSGVLNMPKSQFVRPYVKISTRAAVDYKGFGYGTCMLRVGDTLLKEKILMSMKVMTEYAEESISEL